ncbi:glycosyltransferase family 4 protein [Desulfurella sp.]|uniref:glycosyltransferase family 4 protein n=2 Tax=Desulfurella sp. TaxID=1962857 RepID=UPI000CAD4DE6|nr:glycosyltransferase family 4 protein [Desulfurella sp.]PMP88909.1 MAG: hypothetical protein C0173_06380 [Desulfurella sp.]
MNITIILDEPWNSSLTFLGNSFLETLEKSHQVSLICQKDSYIDKYYSKVNEKKIQNRSFNNASITKYYINNLRTKNPIVFFKNLNQIRMHLNAIKPDIVLTIRGDATFQACLLKNHFNFKLIRIFGENRKPSLNRHCIDYVFLSTKRYENIVKIPHSIINGVVDTKKFTFKKEGALRVRKEFGIDNSDFVFGFIGRTSKVKGIFMLCQAFAKLEFSAKLFMLVYETEIKISEILEIIKQLNIENRVIIESKLRDDVEDIISAFDVGVVSSIDSEAIARTTLEFLACSKPCVVTNVGCLSEVVDDSCGIICKPNVSSLHQALTCIHDKDLSLMGTFALKKAQKYSIESLSDLINDTFSNIFKK